MSTHIVKNTNLLDSILDISEYQELIPAPKPKKEKIVVVENQSDRELIKKVLLDNIKKATEAVDEMSNIANSSESFKDYGALASLLEVQRKSALEFSDLLDKEEKKNLEEQPNSPTTVNNNLILTGTTTDIIQKLKDKLLLS